jgi:hypothetical protein
LHALWPQDTEKSNRVGATREVGRRRPRRAAGYWTKAIVEIGIAIAIEIEETETSTLPDNVEILDFDAVARG